MILFNTYIIFFVACFSRIMCSKENEENVDRVICVGVPFDVYGVWFRHLL